MAKGIYLGIDSLSRKVKKMYLGIEGVARKVKKGYVGVNGLARLFFSGKYKVVRYGYIDNLSETRYGIAGASVKDWAVFAGGQHGPNNQSDAIDYYDENYTHSSGNLTRALGYGIRGDSSNGKAYFHRGRYTQVVNNSLTEEEIDWSQSTGMWSEVCSLSDGVAVAGGDTATNSGEPQKWCYYVDSDNSISQYPDLTYAVSRMGAARAWNKAFFAGGMRRVVTVSRVVNQYSADGTKEADLQLSNVGGMTPAVAATKDYLFIAGGASIGSEYKDVNAFNSDLTRFSAPDLQKGGGYKPKNMVLEGYVVIGAGSDNSTYYSQVDCYTSDLTKEELENIGSNPSGSFLERAGGDCGGSVLGESAFFAGGHATLNGDPEILKGCCVYRLEPVDT